MSMLDWAKKEVELAKIIEGEGLEEGEFDYGGACYDSALKAFESLMEDGHSGMSIKITQQILNRLIDGSPLTPIEDRDDIWNDISYETDSYKHYQCKRMSSLFKYVYADGTVTYSDVDRVYCFDYNNKNTRYSSGLITNIINEMFPIEMPYIPTDKPIAVARLDWLVDKRYGDYDTVKIFYAIMPDGTEIAINRYFKEDQNHTWVEIDESEFKVRIKEYHD